jgi:uncharacterized coiled-coil protein SlyX
MDFVAFMNTAKKDSLLALHGITAELADRIIAARPFTSVEELKKVSGVTSDLIEKWKFEYTANRKVDDKTPAPAPKSEKIIPQPKKLEPAPRKKGNAGRIFKTTLITLLILAAIAAAVYFGVPYFRDKIMRPLESNTSRIGELSATQSFDVERLETEITLLQDRITTLEAQSAASDQTITSLSTDLADLEKVQATLQADLIAQQSGALSSRDEQLTITRALELLSRSRLYLSQNNYGIAKADISAARNLLFPLLETISPDQADGLRVVINRLDMALENLPGYPVVAVSDVDIAWQMLIDGLPNVAEPLVTPLVTTQTAVPTPQLTPTPQQTLPVGGTPTP